MSAVNTAVSAAAVLTWVVVVSLSVVATRTSNKELKDNIILWTGSGGVAWFTLLVFIVLGATQWILYQPQS